MSTNCGQSLAKFGPKWAISTKPRRIKHHSGRHNAQIQATTHVCVGGFLPAFGDLRLAACPLRGLFRWKRVKLRRGRRERRATRARQDAPRRNAPRMPAHVALMPCHTHMAKQAELASSEAVLEKDPYTKIARASKRPNGGDREAPRRGSCARATPERRPSEM